MASFYQPFTVLQERTLLFGVTVSLASRILVRLSSVAEGLKDVDDRLPAGGLVVGVTGITEHQIGSDNFVDIGLSMGSVTSVLPTITGIQTGLATEGSGDLGSLLGGSSPLWPQTVGRELDPERFRDLTLLQDPSSEVKPEDRHLIQDRLPGGLLSLGVIRVTIFIKERRPVGTSVDERPPDEVSELTEPTGLILGVLPITVTEPLSLVGSLGSVRHRRLISGVIVLFSSEPVPGKRTHTLSGIGYHYPIIRDDRT